MDTTKLLGLTANQLVAKEVAEVSAGKEGPLAPSNVCEVQCEYPVVYVYEESLLKEEASQLCGGDMFSTAASCVKGHVNDDVGHVTQAQRCVVMCIDKNSDGISSEDVLPTGDDFVLEPSGEGNHVSASDTPSADVSENEGGQMFDVYVAEVTHVYSVSDNKDTGIGSSLNVKTDLDVGENNDGHTVVNEIKGKSAEVYVATDTNYIVSSHAEDLLVSTLMMVLVVPMVCFRL